MKTRLILSLTMLSLLLAACVAPMPAPPPRIQLPGSKNPQLPLEQKAEANTTQIELPVVPATTEKTEAVLRYEAQRQLYEAGYRPPNAIINSQTARYLAMKQLYEAGYRYSPLLVAMTRYEAVRQLYAAGYRPPNALLNGQMDRYTAMKQLYDAGYRPPNALLDNTR
jgi:hypothetical protein